MAQYSQKVVSTSLVRVCYLLVLLWFQRTNFNLPRICSAAGGGVLAEADNGRVSQSVLDSAREELEGRTGNTDSEDEGAADAEGSL